MTLDRERREAVLKLLRERTAASIGEIADQFHVSEMTIRRDIQKLTEAGQVLRVPGGVRLQRTYGAERTFLERLQKMGEAKRAIGQVAASLVQEKEAVAIDSGTTTLHIARYLGALHNATVFTYSLAVLEELAGAESIRVELTGGIYRVSSHDLTGDAVTASLETVFADRTFFGAASVSFSRGIMVNDPEAQRAILRAGRQKILVVDSSKIGLEARYRLCGISDCDLIITDSLIKDEVLNELQRYARVLVAQVTTRDASGPAATLT